MCVKIVKYKLLYEIEAHFTKSIAHEKAAEAVRKGVSAEADAVAGILLAVRRISALLSCNAECYRKQNVPICVYACWRWLSFGCLFF